MALENVLDDKSCFFSVGKTIETKAKALLDSAERVWSQQTFFERERSRFLLERD